MNDYLNYLKFIWIGKLIIVIVLFFGNTLVYCENRFENIELVPLSNHFENTGDSINENEFLYPSYDIHLGAEIVNLVHIGLKYRLLDRYILEFNFIPHIPNLIFVGYPIIGIGAGFSWQFLKNEPYLLNFQIPFYSIDFKNSFQYFVPSLNICWFQKSNKQSLTLKAGFCLLYSDKEKTIKPKIFMINIGAQLGFSF